MNCPGCKARNPIGNKFCRECGQKIPLEENILVKEEAQKAETERARERAAQLLTKAFTLSQQGKPAEALPLAEEAAELLPASTSALTLCSTLYERLGQNAKAISMMEKVVTLNPGSAVDIDKLDRLRRGVHLLPQRPLVIDAPTEESPRRWMSVIAAVATGGLVLVVGITALVKKINQKSPAPLAVMETTTAGSPNFFGNGASKLVAPNPTGTVAGPMSPPQMAARTDPFAPIGARPMSASPLASFNAEREPRAERIAGNPVLPNPREFGTRPNNNSGVEGVPPVVVPPNNGGAGLPPLGGVQRNPEAIPAGPPATLLQPSGGNSAPTTNEPPLTENPPVIRVREHTNTGSTGGENRPSSAGLGTDPLLRAQTLQATGKYREALTSFREALAAGAAIGDIQQGIALCYQRLGEKVPARTAYQQAIQAFEAQIQAGRRVEQAQRGISACRAALDVLGI